MRYQERIYIQNDNNGVRNKDILNVNMSSDFCVFQSPTFDISGATKISCDSTIECDLSGFSATDILTASTQDCFTNQSMSFDCFSSTTWNARIYENDVTVYSASYYTTLLSASTPTNDLYIDIIKTGLTSLGYTYTVTGGTFTVDRRNNQIQSIEFDICLDFGIKPNILSCPVGFSATPANDACVQILVTGSTYNGSGATIVRGNQNNVYGSLGAYFYPNIQNNGALPLNYTSGGTLLDQTGGTITALNINNTASFWGNPLNSSSVGRLNNVGLSASSTEWLGFTKCIDIPSGGTYYIGMAADNFCRFSLNGQLIVEIYGTLPTPDTSSGGRGWLVWNVFPVELNSGPNIIEMEGLNATSVTSFGAEIYNPVNYATLTGATGSGSSQANIIFTTLDKVGDNYDIGNTMGYSCPLGYALDGCGTAYTCTKIITTGFTGTSCTASCLDNCTIICGNAFPSLSAGSQGVYVLTASTIPISFNFTGNTEAFTLNNASFKYEIYKFNNDLNVFVVPPVYSSSIISYSAFSGTNIINETIPVSGLSLDGEYLIKGYYEFDACTDFLRRLGKRIDTTLYKQGTSFQLYTPNLDYYFVGVKAAEIPTFTQSQNNDLLYYTPLPLYQQVILVDTTMASDDYELTGSTFALVSDYIGDIIVTLNGFVLAKDLDYILSGYSLTFLGSIVNGDVITINYTKTNSVVIVSDTIQITTVIPSGSTDTQGSNKYFYNTTTGKYEIYTTNQPLEFSNIMVMLNGVTLTSNIDYYQSTSNSNRIILEGSLAYGDVIVIIYYPKANIINGITLVNNFINWHIPTQPQLDNGYFSLEYSQNNDFSTYVVNSTVDYIPLVTDYSSILTLTGDVGTRLYYRVRNIKNFVTICSDDIISTATSETVSVVIQTNAINSY